MKKTKGVLKKVRSTNGYWVARTSLEFTERLNEIMRKQDLSRADLARAINKSPAYVTKIFRGTTNFTLESLVQLCSAVDSKISIKIIESKKASTGTELFEENFERSEGGFAWGRINIDASNYDLGDEIQSLNGNGKAAVAA